MAQPSGTFDTYDSSSNAEDVSDIIFNISPVDTPLMTLSKKGKAEAKYTEWPIDSLAAVDDTNAVIEGDEASGDTLTSATRVGNYVQTSDKVVVVSTAQDAVRKYGRSKESMYQIAKAQKALKRDMETIMLLNQARVVGDSSTATKLRGLPGWITTNDSRGSGGADGNATTAATDGTQRNFSESLLKAVIVSCATNANDMPSVLMAGPANRANISSQLSGNSSRFYELKDGTLNASISVYRSDYGPLKVVMNRFQRERDMFLLNPDYLEIRFLEPFQQQDLAVTGLSKKKQIWASYTLAVLNQGAHGVLADLNTSVL